MGNAESSNANDFKSHNVPLRLPMPDRAELDERFNKVLASMNLPADKMKVLARYDADKKWQLVCDKDLVQVKHPPSYFVKTINSYLDHSLNGKKFKKRINRSTRVLRDLEISLRTNHIGWVREFLDKNHRGLDVLVNYLAFAQYALVHDLSMSLSAPSTLRRQKAHSAGDVNMGGSWKNLSGKKLSKNATIKSNAAFNHRTIDRKLKHSRTIIDREDVHVCITCLRAIMNYQQGFTLVMAHNDCINQIVLSLKNKSFKTKSLVLELLAAVCLVQGGHDIILRAFDNFKTKCGETRRFDSLMKCFESETENIEFMVSCMQFINIVVHSVEDMNFRVHLQHEFSLLGLDTFLDSLRLTESDRLKVQIQAYLDNMFDVSNLLEDSESKQLALERIERLEDQLLKKNEQNTWIEYENSCKIVQLEKQLSSNIEELNHLKGQLTSGKIPPNFITPQNHSRLQEQLQSGLPLTTANAVESQLFLHSDSSPAEQKSLTADELMAKSAQLGKGESRKLPPIQMPPSMSSLPDEPDNPLGFKVKTKDFTSGRDASTTSPPPPSLIVTSQLNIPPPPILSNIPPPPAIGVPQPPPIGMARIPNLPPGSGLKQKKVYKPKYRMQNLNLTPMRPNQVAGTIFNDLDDDSVINMLNMEQFEEMFKTKAQDSAENRQRLQRFVEQKKNKRGITIIDTNRARNLSILLRKIGMTTDEICQALYSYDLSRLSLEHVEMLPSFMPNEMELKLFKEHEKSGKSFDELTPEDKFMWLFGRVERLQQRLTIMIFIGSFHETHVTLLPQIAGVIAASMSIKSSTQLKRVLEVVLAFGNYMNSSKRGAVYGFKLQSLDALVDTKSIDKKWTLLHYIVQVLDAHYPEAKTFYKELRYVDRACKVSFENILSDVNQIKKGMHMTEMQCEVDNHATLTSFIEKNKKTVDKILQDTETAKEAYENVVKYFGETTKTMPPETFFPMIDRFINAYKRAEREVEDRKIAEAKLLERQRLKEEEMEEKRRKGAEEIRKDGERMLEGGRRKGRRDIVEMKDGAIEDNINYLKSEPYRRSDTVLRSTRKLSRGNEQSRELSLAATPHMSTML